jgi:serine/threonine-protein kinase
LLPPDDSLRPFMTRQLQQSERSLALDRKLAPILDGKDKPADDGERLDLAALCQQPYQQRYAASCRFFTEAFAHDARLADDLQQQHRYNAACAAALAGCGQGKDADQLTDPERARLRKQAVEWLRADLASWARQAQSKKPGDREQVRMTLEHWQDDADLAGLRDRAAVGKLPPDERESCLKLWADVAELLKKAGDAK